MGKDRDHSGFFKSDFVYELRPWICVGFALYALVYFPQVHTMMIPAVILIASAGMILFWRHDARKPSIRIARSAGARRRR